MQVTDAMVAAALDAYNEALSEIVVGGPRAVESLDDIREIGLRAALETALAKMWRPIEEAPKDGTRILMRGTLDPIPDQRELYSGLDISTTAAGYWDQIDDAWTVVGATWLGPFFQPTAWQPLPPPPRGK